jgi:hypothetical protein
MVVPDGVFISAGDVLMDSGMTAACWFGNLAPE